MKKKRRILSIEEYMQMSPQEIEDFLDNDQEWAEIYPNESNIDFHGRTIKEIAEEQGLKTLDEVFDGLLQKAETCGKCVGKHYNSYSFRDYPPKEILKTGIYKKSIKRMSFQYRTKDGDRLIAYIAFSKEPIPMNPSSLKERMKGCRILDIYVEPTIYNGCLSDNEALRDALLDDALFYINGWVDIKSNEFEYDYFWFYNADIKYVNTIEEIGGMTTVDNISYKLVNRLST